MPLSENWGRNEGLLFATAMDGRGRRCERLAATVAGALTGS